jgi:hypothetical protein
MNTRPLSATALAALLVLSIPVVPMPVQAQQRPQGGRPTGPSPEAIAACQGQAVGAKVSFQGRHGRTFTGSCQTVDGVLAARPDGPPPGDGASAPAK